MAPLRSTTPRLFGDDTGAAFDGLVQILQSVMGAVGQVVMFANMTVKLVRQEIFSFITQTAADLFRSEIRAA